MTNPDNIVRVRARNGGRASVYEANAWAQTYGNSGLVSGNGVLPNTSPDMNVLVGGSQVNPDVVLAENPAGYKIALDIVGQQAIAITAPASNSRISAVVAYTDDLSLSSTETTITGSPATCGLIVVNGTASASPVAPTDTQIRSAITADGATGSQAAYAVIALITVASNATLISESLISVNQAMVASNKIEIDFTTLPFGNYSLEEVDTGFTWVDGKPVFKKTVVATISGAQKVAHGISNFGELVDVSGSVLTSGGVSLTLPARSTTGNWINIWTVSATEISCETSIGDTLTWRINLRYTKSS